MATPKIPKKEKASELLKLRRKAVKLGREASTRFGKSLKQSKSSRLLQQLTKGKTNLPRIPGSAVGAPLLNRTLRPLSSGLIGRAGLAIQGIQTARSVFDKDDNIITSLRNIGRTARGQEALGNSAVAQAYNKRRALKIDQSLEQIYKDAPMSNKVVKYGSSVDADAIQEAENTAALAKTITTNNSEISPDTLSKIGGTVGYMDSGGNWIGGPGTIKPGSDVDSTPSETPPIQKRNELVINKAENNVFTIDPATGKPVGVITRNQRRELQKRLDAAKKLKNKNISSVLNTTVA